MEGKIGKIFARSFYDEPNPEGKFQELIFSDKNIEDSVRVPAPRKNFKEKVDFSKNRKLHFLQLTIQFL